MDQSIKRFGNNYTKKNKNSKVKRFAYFFKTIKLKVMKSIRNQINYPKGLQFTMLL